MAFQSSVAQLLPLPPASSSTISSLCLPLACLSVLKHDKCSLASGPPHMLLPMSGTLSPLAWLHAPFISFSPQLRRISSWEDFPVPCFSEFPSPLYPDLTPPHPQKTVSTYCVFYQTDQNLVFTVVPPTPRTSPQLLELAHGQ